MRAVILVGGEGTRLRPLTYATPKQMLPILGRPMLEWVFANLRTHGVTDVTLSLGYLPDAFVEAYPEGSLAGVGLNYAVEPERLDTAGAIKFAAEYAGINETFVVLNGDVLTDLNLTSLMAFHRSHGAAATLALHEVEDPSAFGVVPTDDEGRVLAFIEKPRREDAPTRCINAGTYVFEPSVLDLIASGRKVSVERETFPELVAEGSLYAMPGDCYWIDAGTPEAFLRAHYDLLDGTRNAIPPSWATHQNDAWLEEGAVVLGSVTDASYVSKDSVVEERALVSKSMLCEGSTIASGARVTNSVVMAGATISAGAVIDRSIIGPGATIGQNARVEDLSVVGSDVAVGAGELLSGVRLPI